jgi:catechol 2,3-dioxygenase-like lactoylglutathione lyase family enzyme
MPKSSAPKSAKKKPAKKASAKKTVVKAKAAVKKAKPAAKPVPIAVPDTGDKLTFNHAMIYSRDVSKSLEFYRGMLGFKVVDEFLHDGILLYARLRAPGGDGMIALHLAGPGIAITSDGVRLYFEIRNLDDFCRKLQAKGLYLPSAPKVMPWGWRHIYINDPDGHEISLYWAGEMRMQKTVMAAAKRVEKTPVAQ